jgi:hypothetical protein
MGNRGDNEESSSEDGREDECTVAILFFHYVLFIIFILVYFTLSVLGFYLYRFRFIIHIFCIVLCFSFKFLSA